MRLVWTRPALRALEAIGEHLERENPDAATRIVARIVDLTRTLEQYPHRGRPGRAGDTRELVVTDTPFIVPYRVRHNRIEILSVLHGARKWPTTF